MNTVKSRITDVLTTEYPNALTNGQLAARVDAPEPSVRRATKQLEDAGEICLKAQHGNQLDWQRREDKMPQVEDAPVSGDVDSTVGQQGIGFGG
jgi:hypothetical protein